MGKAFFLLVDDEELVTRSHRRIAKLYFKKGGYEIEIVTADSGGEALDLVRKRMTEKPDAEWGLITDYDMPHMNGGQLIDELDKLLGDKLLLRLVISGLLDDERKKEIEAKQAFIDSKPIIKDGIESYLNIFTMNLSR